MKRALHQAIVFFAILLVVTLVRLPYGSYRDSVLPWLRESLTPQGITVDFADIVLEPPLTMFLNKLNLIIPVQRFPLLVNVESARLSMHPMSLLLLRASGSGEVKLYDGSIVYDFVQRVWGKTLDTRGTFTNISLAAHPFLGSFGVSGTLEGKFAGRYLKDEAGNYLPEKGDFSLALRGGALHGGIKLLQLIRVPEIPNASLVAQAAYDENAVTLSTISFDSSLLTFDGKGKIRRRTLALLGEGKITGTLHLTDEGKPVLGGYLALAAHTAVDNPATEWNVEVTFDPAGKPLATIAPRA